MTIENEPNQDQSQDIDYEALDRVEDNIEEVEAQDHLEEQEIDEVIQEEKPRPKGRGYLTKDQWVAEGRDPAKFKSKEQFEEFGEAYTVMKPHLDKFKAELKNKDFALDAMAKNIEEIKKAEFLRAKAIVEADLRRAKEIGDVEAVSNLTGQKLELDQKERVQNSQSQQAEERRVNEIFMSRNAHWFNDQHVSLKQEAIDEDNRIKNQRPDLNYAARVQLVEDYMNLAHPDLRQVAKRSSDHVSGSRSAVNKSSMNAAPTEENMYRNLSSRDKTDFLEIKKLVQKQGINYTVKLFLEQNNKYKGAK